MIVFTCEDTFEAMMSCIYDAWSSKIEHQNIRLQTEPLGNLELFCEYIPTTADYEKALKVTRSIQQKISYSAYMMIYKSAMSTDPNKLDAIYRFLLLGFSYPDTFLNMLQHPYVQPIYKLSTRVSNEMHLFRESLRFQSVNNHVFISHMEPHSNILALLYPCFDDRMPSENWMIIDDTRRLAAVHSSEQPTYLTSLSETEFQRLKETEQLGDPFLDLWKVFFETVAIKERWNPICQRNHLPLWYRKHVVEFQS